MFARMSPETWKGLMICVMYAACSTFLSMMYKAILSVWDFQCSFILLACQVSAGLGFCLIAMQVAPGSPLLQLKPFKLETFRASLPLGLLYVVNLAVGWWGLALVDVPMFLAIRRTTTVMTMVIEFFMIGTAPSTFVRLAVGVMMLGTIVAGWESFNDDFRGYMFTLLNNLITAVQLNFAKKFRNEHDVQGFGLVFYNGLTALPVSLLLAGVLGEFEVAANYEFLAHPGFIAAVLIASVSGAFMTYVVLLCATVNSPTATSVTGNIKDIVTTFIGASLFAGFEPTFAKVLGLGISFVGGGWFSYLKLEESGALSKPVEPVKATIVAGPIEEDAFEEDAMDSGDEAQPLSRVGQVASASGAPKEQGGPTQASATSAAEPAASLAPGPRILAAVVVGVIAITVALLATGGPTQTAEVLTQAPTTGPVVADAEAVPSPSADSPAGNASATLRQQLQYRGHELTGEYSIIRSFPHDPQAFTQGLAMFDGKLFESTGLYGRSSIRELDPQTGSVLRITSMSDAVFGEGMTVMETGLAKVLTWRARQAVSYNVSTFGQIGKQSFRSETGEGWGLAYDGDDLLLTDGSDRLQRVNKRTMQTMASTLVQGSSGRVRLLNEAEWVLGEVLANVWFQTYIVRIDPSSGRVLGTLDMSRVGIPVLHADGNNVLNGIACDPSTFADDEGVKCFVTGKEWDRMHELRLLTRPRAAGGASR